ncbi:hypothetical protein, partial [Limnoraphis robusta]|uniref:hypothetical protein n=1 Tax=Limnoraphis robusta TaxID=1118279 RepID=UPI002B20C0D7
PSLTQRLALDALVGIAGEPSGLRTGRRLLNIGDNPVNCTCWIPNYTSPILCRDSQQLVGSNRESLLVWHKEVCNVKELSGLFSLLTAWSPVFLRKLPL